MNRLLIVAGALTGAVLVTLLGCHLDPVAAGVVCALVGLACALAGVAITRRGRR